MTENNHEGNTGGDQLQKSDQLDSLTSIVEQAFLESTDTSKQLNGC